MFIQFSKLQINRIIDYGAVLRRCPYILCLSSDTRILTCSFCLFWCTASWLPFHFTVIFFSNSDYCAAFVFTVYRLFHVHLRFLLSREKGGISGEAKHFENLILSSVGLFGDAEALVLCRKVPHTSVGKTVLARQCLSRAITKRGKML